MNSNRWIAVTLFAGLLATACGSSSDLGAKTTPYEPRKFAAASEYEAIVDKDAALCLTGGLSMEFTAPGQMVGLSLALAAGDSVQILTAGAVDLDTVVALYGPADASGYYGELPVAADDDSGADGKGRIDGYAVKTTGSYLVVVSTYGGTGLGLAAVSVTINGKEGCAGSGEAACDASGACPTGRTCVNGTCVASGACADGSNPQPEVCDGLDNDCDGLVDEDCPAAPCSRDADCQSGWVCDATTALCVVPGACAEGSNPQPEACDGLDNDCDGLIDEDCPAAPCSRDADCQSGWVCDATTALCVVPGACADGSNPQPEACDGLDNDCDGLVDEDCPAAPCSQDAECPVGQSCVNGVCVVSGACADGSNPQPEACDALDNDCDGLVDEDCPAAPCSQDADCQSGWICDATTALCVVPGACADGSNPQPEACDGLDNDCDGLVDEDCPAAACTQDTECPVGQSCVNGECVVSGACTDPTDPQPEVCDGLDNDCDGLVDEDCPAAPCNQDADCQSGWICDATTALCVVPGACADGSNPQPEVCDGLDNNCDGLVDENCPAAACTQDTECPVGQSCENGVCVVSGACADGSNPQPEVCDGLDNDCDGLVDEDCPAAACAQDAECQAGQACVNGVCVVSGACTDPTDPQPEVCDGLDNDCDGLVDEDCPAAPCNQDTDCLQGQVCISGLCTAA